MLFRVALGREMGACDSKVVEETRLSNNMVIPTVVVCGYEGAPTTVVCGCRPSSFLEQCSRALAPAAEACSNELVPATRTLDGSLAPGTVACGWKVPTGAVGSGYNCLALLWCGCWFPATKSLQLWHGFHHEAMRCRVCIRQSLRGGLALRMFAFNHGCFEGFV